MAGLDEMFDVRRDILDYIELKIRKLLDDPLNEFQDPNWVQAATLFEQLIVPLDIYIMDGLFSVAQNIVKKAEKNKKQVIYVSNPEMYNQEILDLQSIENDLFSDGPQIIKYDGIVDNIKKWIKHQKELKKEYR